MPNLGPTTVQTQVAPGRAPGAQQTWLPQHAPLAVSITTSMQQTCSYRPGGSCAAPDARVTVRPGGRPSVTLGFLLADHNGSLYHYAKWEERSRGTELIMRRAAAHLAVSPQRPLDAWVHVADVGFPELPLPVHPSGITLETVSSTRAGAAGLFPDYSFAGWRAIGFDPEERGGLQSFVDALLLAGQQPARAPLRPQAVFVGNEKMHPVRPILRELASSWPELLDVRHVEPYDADGRREFAPEHVPFAALAGWRAVLDAPGGGWSGRLKFLPLLQRPLLVLDRASWGWADGAMLEPYEHYRPVRAAISEGHVGQTYRLDMHDLRQQLEWCRDRPREAAAMAERALRRALEVLRDDAVDRQALAALQAAMAARGRAEREDNDKQELRRRARLR